MSTNPTQPFTPDEEASSSGEFKGIFVSDGVDFTIHRPRLRITADGIEGSHDGVSLRVDLCRQWLRIAIGHVADTKAAAETVLEAHAKDDEEALGQALNRECHAAMQAIAASAFALDALYAGIKERIPRPDQPAREVPEFWTRLREGSRWILTGRIPRRFGKARRPTRWKQIAETYRIGFKLKPQLTAKVREALRKSTKYRDMAVHPPADQKAPVLRKEIARGVGWNFMAFRYHNAATCTQIVLAVLGRILQHPDPKFTDLVPYAEALKKEVETLAEEWSSTHPEFPVREEDL